MKIKSSLLLGAAVIVTTLPAAAREGRFPYIREDYPERARQMYDAGNYAGAIDQLSVPETRMQHLPDGEKAKAMFLLASSLYNRGDARCLDTAREITERFPASGEAVRAAVLEGDFHFFRHEWPEAVTAYEKADADRLPTALRDDFTYRLMLSLIKTGHYAEARPLTHALAGAKGYRNASIFYTAYLDYIDGKFTKAYEGFSRVPEGIDGLDAAYYMAQIEYTHGNYERASATCRRLLASSPDPEFIPETERIAGLSLFKMGDMREALAMLEKYAAHTGEMSEDARYALGMCLYEDGDYERAAATMRPLTTLRDRIGQGAWLCIGQCALQADDPTAAALAFEKAARMEEDRDVSETALYNYAAAVTRGGKVPFSSSADLLERFASSYPDSEFAPAVEQYLATAYYNDRDYRKALRSINAIRNPSREVTAAKQKVLYELGILSLTGGQPSEAARYLEECTSINTSDKALCAEAFLWLGDARYALGHYAEAARSYNAFLSGPGDARNRAAALYGLAYSRYKQQDYPAAARDFAKALDARPSLPSTQGSDALLRRADCLYYTGKYAEAATLYADAVAQGVPDTDYALYREAVMAGLAGNTARKLDLLSRAEKEFPSSRWLAPILLEKAVTYEETGRSDMAADAYKRRLTVKGDVDADELFRMASAMHKAGRWEDLLEVTDRIRRAGQLDTDELADLDLYDADALSHTGKGSRAADIYRQLAGTPSSLTGAKAAVAYGHYLLGEKRYADAEKAMLEFTDAGTPHEYWLARGFIILADAYSGLGKDYLAREYLNSLRDNYPGEEEDIADMIASRLKKLNKQSKQPDR